MYVEQNVLAFATARAAFLESLQKSLCSGTVKASLMKSGGRTTDVVEKERVDPGEENTEIRHTYDNVQPSDFGVSNAPETPAVLSALGMIPFLHWPND